jgi:DNA-binding transcriptional LysR family regulator
LASATSTRSGLVRSLIANGDGVALVPESAARYYGRPGITYRPVTGVSPRRVAVAWAPASDTDPVVQDFIRCCVDLKPSPYAGS